MDLQTFTLATEKWLNDNGLNLSLSGTARIFDGQQILWSASLIWKEGKIPEPKDENYALAREEFQQLMLPGFTYSNIQLITFFMQPNTFGSRWQVAWKNST